MNILSFALFPLKLQPMATYFQYQKYSRRCSVVKSIVGTLILWTELLQFPFKYMKRKEKRNFMNTTLLYSTIKQTKKQIVPFSILLNLLKRAPFRKNVFQHAYPHSPLSFPSSDCNYGRKARCRTYSRGAVV